MRRASIAEVKSRFGAFLKASEAGPVVVTRSRRPVAVIVSVRGEDEVARLVMAHSPELRAILERSRKEIKAGNALSHDEFWAEVAKSRRSRPLNGKRRTVRN